ncbi:DUF7344 domain-containing protein [Halobellus limi]|uniref:DUF7344 domain-containing protein n=1 Tax=Halobellus limi TaxID=699433 RepID=A0A1H6BDV4_9EURY|nr:hypothetical protein [Halobellus limi]SEG58396.1 hypothetical protein SAMN04488133_2752 [Halobellus limi]
MSAGKSGSIDEGSLARTGNSTDGGETDVDDDSNLEMIGQASRSNGSSLDKGEIFDLLKNSRRRSTIRYLREHGGNAELKDIAEHIAAEENDTTVRQLSSDQRKRVYIGLYQCHLPKMDKLGVVEYDKNRGTIELQDSVAQLLQYIEPVEEDEGLEWSWTVPAVAAFLVVVVSLGTFGVGPLSAVPPTGWTLVSVAGIAFIVGIQYLQ